MIYLFSAPETFTISTIEHDLPVSTPDDSDILDDTEETHVPSVSIDYTDETSTPPTSAQGPRERAHAKNDKKQKNTSNSGGNSSTVTVASVIPRPTKCLIDSDRVSECSDELLR